LHLELETANAIVMRNENGARWQRYASRPSPRRYGESEGVPLAQDVVQMSRGMENLHYAPPPVANF